VVVAQAARVLVADDHAPTRAMVRRTIEAGGFVVCAEAADAEEAVQGARQTGPDVALLDVRMPGGGVHAAERIAASQPGTAIVMLTVSAEDDDLFAALAAGASGYLLKGGDPAAIPVALTSVLSGEAALAGNLAKRLVDEHRARERQRRFRGRVPREAPLTRREWEVLELLGDGLGTADIARRLFIAEVTVRSHVAAIVRKLRVRDRAGILGLLRGEVG